MKRVYNKSWKDINNSLIRRRRNEIIYLFYSSLRANGWLRSFTMLDSCKRSTNITLYAVYVHWAKLTLVLTLTYFHWGGGTSGKSRTFDAYLSTTPGSRGGTEVEYTFYSYHSRYIWYCQSTSTPPTNIFFIIIKLYIYYYYFIIIRPIIIIIENILLLLI